MHMEIRAYINEDLSQMTAIWNEVVLLGNAFPQTEPLTEETAASFFATQSFSGVAVVDGKILGLYILHPNNIGRCGHLANASYAVSSVARGQGIGEALVVDSLNQAKQIGFRILQFNAVVCSNYSAMHLYEKLGFTKLGIVPSGFKKTDNQYEDIALYYYVL